MNDKTMKIPAFKGEAKGEAAPGNLTQDQALSLEVAKLTTQLEEERSKGLDCLKLVEWQRDNLKKEQARFTELEAKVAAAETKVKELTEALNKISSISAEATQVKAGQASPRIDINLDKV